MFEHWQKLSVQRWRSFGPCGLIPCTPERLFDDWDLFRAEDSDSPQGARVPGETPGHGASDMQRFDAVPDSFGYLADRVSRQVCGRRDR